MNISKENKDNNKNEYESSSIFSDVSTKENTEINHNFSIDSSLWSKENMQNLNEKGYIIIKNFHRHSWIK